MALESAQGVRLDVAPEPLHSPRLSTHPWRQHTGSDLEHGFGVSVWLQIQHEILDSVHWVQPGMQVQNQLAGLDLVHRCEPSVLGWFVGPTGMQGLQQPWEQALLPSCCHSFTSIFLGFLSKSWCVLYIGVCYMQKAWASVLMSGEKPSEPSH